MVIPVDFGYVSLIGMYHGVGKPNYRRFLELLLKELRYLHPRSSRQIPRTLEVGSGMDLSDPSQVREREVALRVRCMIVDGKEKPVLRGLYNIYISGCAKINQSPLFPSSGHN